jgi:serine/threonine protein kinase
MIGSTILHYKILERLGQGRMGVVYLAEDLNLERKVAIKFLPKQISENTEERQRIKIEAKANFVKRLDIKKTLNILWRK